MSRYYRPRCPRCGAPTWLNGHGKKDPEVRCVCGFSAPLSSRWFANIPAWTVLHKRRLSFLLIISRSRISSGPKQPPGMTSHATPTEGVIPDDVQTSDDLAAVKIKTKQEG